jgi:hypothetical protein
MRLSVSALAARAAIAILASAVISLAACGGALGKQYEYEEDYTLAVDGSATLNINASMASLVALRGLDVDPNPRIRFDSEKVRRAFEAAGCAVTRVSSRPWIRDGRRFVQVRMDLPDIRQAPKCGALAWSTYTLDDRDGELVYRQHVGMPAGRDPGNVGWSGEELVAFKLRLPSKIKHHNRRDIDTNEVDPPDRGNILAWEQRLKDRRIGTPVVMELRMERESILYRTLWLFAGAFVAAAALMVGLIWWTIRRGRRRATARRPPA